MAPTESVVFDVGNVLLRWDPRSLVEEQLPGEVAPERLIADVFSHSDWTELDRGSLEEEDANVRFAQRSGLPLAKVRQLHLASKASLAPIESSVKLLEELHRAGTSLYCLSNMSRGTFQFVHRRFEFWRCFRGIVVSSHVGLIKPDPAIYQRLLDTYSLAAEDCVLLDDSAANVETARALGMRAHVYTDADEARRFLKNSRG